MHRRAVTHFITLAILISQSVGELVIAPRDTESKVGDTTYFNCSTDLESVEIFWYHGDTYIYNGHGILEPYNGRFEIERNYSIGSHNLVIHSMEPSDAGEYICADDDGSGTRRSAQLVVLDDDPICQSNIQPDGVIGQNIFNIPLDEVQLTCNVTYIGNIPPQMEWKKDGDNGSIKDNVTSIFISTNRVMYNLKLKGDISLDKSSYVCQTKRSTQNQYNCTSETIKVLHFVKGNTIEQRVVRGDKITCVARNNTFPCTSQWYHYNYTCSLPCNETITTHLLGEYLCTVKCHVRGRDYYFEALKAFVVEPITSPLLSTSDTIAVAVPIVIIVLIIAVVSIAVLTVHNKRTKRKDNITEDEIELLHKIKTEDLKEEEIRGVAILNEKLFVVRANSSKIRVYNCNDNSKSFHNWELVEVKELVSTWDMCACKRNNCLYIMDGKAYSSPREVLKISTDGNSLKNWSTEYNARGNLSVTTEGNVIITVKHKHSLLEYSPDGVLLCEIKLSLCKNPLHAIKMDERYIVSHGDNSDLIHRVCLVDKEGNVEMAFGHHFGSTENQLHVPFHLAVHSSGCVIVADLINNRMLLLDSNLEFKTKIVPKCKQNFLSPYALCLNETMLVVLISGVDSNEATSKEADDSKIEEGETSLMNHDLLIEKDCRLLVFDIKQLLQKYDL